jgi:hypothetical protein
MNCPRCGTLLPNRPRARMIITGVIFIVAAFVLLFFVHLAVVVVAAVLMAVVGASSLKAARHPKPMRCPKCRRRG